MVVTAWLPFGPTSAASSLLRQAIARVRASDEPPPVSWGDPDSLQRLLGPHGDLVVCERQLARKPVTAEQQWDCWERLHPLWINARRILEPAGEWEKLRASSIAALREGGFEAEQARPYLLAVLAR